MRIKILFIIYSLDKGGSEKIFSFLANNISLDKFDIYYLTIKKSAKDSFTLKKEVKHIQLDYTRTLFSVLSIIRTISEVKPQIVFTTLSPVNIMVGAIRKIGFFRNVKFVMRESAITSINNKFSSRPTFLLDLLTKYIYGVFDKIVAQSIDMRDDLINAYKVRPNKVELINNPTFNFFNVNAVPVSTQRPQSGFLLMTVGNLRVEKGQDRLIKAVALLKNKIDFQLWIIGDGVKRPELEKLICDLGMEEHVKLLGHKNEVGNYLKIADLFLQGSYYEGFPNVLLEANSFGVPVLAYDVKGGTKEIVQDGLNGFLVDDGDIQMFSDTILKSLNYSFNKGEIKDYVKSKFDPEVIINKYEQLLTHV